MRWSAGVLQERGIAKSTNILEKVQQIGDGFPLAVGQDVIIVYFAPAYETLSSVKEQDQQQRQHHDDGHRAHTRTTVKGVCAEIPEGGHSQTQPVSVCLPLCTSTDIQRKEEGGQIRCYSMPKQKEEADNGRGRGRGRDRGRIAGENDVVYIAKGAAAVSSVRCEAMRSASLLAGGFGIIELDVPSDGALLYFTVLHRARLP